jgi:phosphotransferase system  glucose/maltose/N-acetylglucosamine-specific IIC component
MSSPQDTAVAEATSFVAKLNEVIIFPTIALLMAVAFLIFIWGCFEYFINAANEEGRKNGVKNITFGIIGLVIMVSAFAILSIFTGTFGLGEELRCADDPTSGGCEGVFRLPDSEASPSRSPEDGSSEASPSRSPEDGSSEASPSRP